MTPHLSLARRGVVGGALLGLPVLLAAQPLTLGDAARLAARQAGPVAVASARTAQAEARVVQRRAELLPQLSGSVTQADRTFNTATLGLQVNLPGANRPLFDPRGEVLGPVPTVDLRARLQQSLIDPSAWARLRAARASADVADVEASAQAEQAATQAAIAYLRVLRAEGVVSARAADSTLAAELLRMAREQLTAGVGVALDVTRAQAQLAGVRAQQIAARAEAERARIELRRAVGMALDAPIALADSLGGRLDERWPAEGALTAEAVRRRPEVQLLEAQRVASDAQRRATWAERLPSLGLVADQGVVGRDYARLLSTYTWGVQLSLPAFDGFRREGRLAEQRAVARELAARDREWRAQVAAEVQIARLELDAAREQLVAARERLALAEQEVAQARDRFTGGVAGNAELVTASLALTSARTQLIDAQTQWQLARVSVARAEGTVRQLP